MILWESKFSVGVPWIDEQHKKLFQIAGEAYKMINEEASNLDFNRVMDVLDQLIDYTKYHFSQEEILMKHFGYPGYDEHIIEHHKLLKFIQDIDYIKINRNPSSSISEILNLLVDWIVNHILNTDYKFKPFIQLAMQKEGT